MSENIPLGIDISKKSFNVSLLRNQKRGKIQEFSNNEEGFLKLKKWLEKQKVDQIHACLEATNIYGHELATFLYELGHVGHWSIRE